MVPFWNPETVQALRLTLLAALLLWTYTGAVGAVSGNPVHQASVDSGDAESPTVLLLGAMLTDPKHKHVIEKTIDTLQANMSSLSNVKIEIMDEYINLTEHLNVIHTICQKMIPKGITALISAIEGENYVDVHIATGFVSMISQYINLPVISINQATVTKLDAHAHLGNSTSHSSYLHVGASMKDQAKAMLAFLQYYDWYHFIIVTTMIPDHDIFISSMENLLFEYAESYDQEWEICDKIEINMEHNLTAQVKLIIESDCTIVLLFSSQQEAQLIMDESNEHGMMEHGNVWIGAETILRNLNGAGEIPDEFPTGLLAVKYREKSYNVERAIQDSTKIYLNGLDRYARSMGHRETLKDIEFTKSCWQSNHRPPESLNKFVKYLSTSPDTDDSDDDYEFDIEGNLKNPKVVIMNVPISRRWDKVGVWTRHGLVINDITWMGGLHQQPEGLTPHRHITFTTITEGSYVSVIELNEEECTAGVRCRLLDDETGLHYYRCCIGFCVDLLLRLSRDIGFIFDLYVVEDLKFGANENGTWNGMVGDILKGNADAAIASLLDTAARSSVIDTSVTFMKSGISVLAKREEGMVPSDAFLAPFDYSVWLLLTVGIVQVVALAIFVFECFSPGGYDRSLTGPRITKFTFGSSLWIVWGLLFNNTVPLKPPRSYTAKFMTNMWGCFSLIFIAMYTANLVAHMIREAPTDMVDGFLDPKLQKPNQYSNPLKFGTIKSTSVEQYIKKVNTKMQEHMDPYNLELAEDAVAAVKHGKVDAFIYDEAALRDLAAKDQDCSLKVVGKTVGETGYTIALTKGSHWTHKINEKIIKYTDSGFLQTLVEKWLTSMCEGKNENSRQPLGIEHSSGVFLLLLGGTAVSILVFFGEHLFFKFLKGYFTKRFAKKELVAVVSEAMARSMYTPVSKSEQCSCRNWSCRQVSQELDAALDRLGELENMVWMSRNGHTNYSNKPKVLSNERTNELKSLWIPLSQQENDNYTKGHFTSDSDTDSETSERNFCKSFDNLDHLDKLHEIMESSV
ncbi:glutamate receptor ionotropic, NMDA 2A-like [Saccoglossus kowalevskii]